MSASQSDPPYNEQATGFDSRDSQIIIFDGPGDATVTPPPPHLLAFLEAEREKVLRWQKLKNQASDQADEGFDCVDIIFDGPGDTTVTPPPPYLLAFLEAEREKVLRWQKFKDQAQSPDKAAE